MDHHRYHVTPGALDSVTRGKNRVARLSSRAEKKRFSNKRRIKVQLTAVMPPGFEARLDLMPGIRKSRAIMIMRFVPMETAETR